jgi:hypothetical protein
MDKENQVKSQSLDPATASILTVIGIWFAKATFNFLVGMGLTWVWHKVKAAYKKRIDKSEEKK